MRHQAAGVTTDLFPKQIALPGIGGELRLPLDYHFEPGSPRDGVTMTVPLIALNQIDRRAVRMAGTRHAEGKSASAAEVAAAETASPSGAASGLCSRIRRTRRRSRRDNR